MSITDNPFPDVAQGATGIPGPRRGGSAPGPRRSRGRRDLFGDRRLRVGALGLAGVLVAGGTAVVLASGGEEPPAPPAAAPVALPGALGGFSAAVESSDAFRQPAWRAKAAAAAPGIGVEGRSYGSPQLRRQIRVVAGRGNLAGKLEFAWASQGGTTVKTGTGDVTCSNELKLTARSAPQARPTMMMCWRTATTLSAYVVVIDFDKEPTARDTADMLDEVWRTARVTA